MILKSRKTRYAVKDYGNARDVALCVLLGVTENDRKSHTLLKETFEEAEQKGADLSRTDRAFVEYLTIGTLDRMITIDTVISRFSKKPLRLLKPVIRGILRISLYQLMYMDRVPASAACNEAVELAKLHGLEGLSGFVNGVLRSAAREIEAGGEKVTVFEETWQEYSLPKWLAAKLEEEYGREAAEEIFRSFHMNRKETVRFNLSLADASDPVKAEELIAEGLRREGFAIRKIDFGRMLRESGQELPDGPLPAVYELEEGGDAAHSDSFRKGLITVQDPSSALVASYAAPGVNDRVIDVCSAPGGKALALADLMNRKGGRGLIEARDVSKQKVALIEENVRRCGFGLIRTEIADALKEDEESYYRADILIADLPCSGIGVIAKKPDIKLNLMPYSIEELQQLQRDILINVSRFVKPKGKLVYSTCTITQEENELNARWAAEHLGFTLQKEMKLLPGADHDGFYIAVMEKHY